jgi:hypothetical protein
MNDEASWATLPDPLPQFGEEEPEHDGSPHVETHA